MVAALIHQPAFTPLPAEVVTKGLKKARRRFGQRGGVEQGAGDFAVGGAARRCAVTLGQS